MSFFYFRFFTSVIISFIITLLILFCISPFMSIRRKTHPLNWLYYQLEVKKFPLMSVHDNINREIFLQNENFFENVFLYFEPCDYEIIKKYQSIKAINKYITRYELDINEQQYWLSLANIKQTRMPSLEEKNLEFIYTLYNEYAFEVLLQNNFERVETYEPNKKHSTQYFKLLALNKERDLLNIVEKHLLLQPLALKHYYSPDTINLDIFKHVISKTHKIKPGFYTCYLTNLQPTKKMLKEDYDLKLINFLDDKNILNCLFEKTNILHDINNIIDHLKGFGRRINNIKEFVMENILVPEKISIFLLKIINLLNLNVDFFQVFFEAELNYKKYELFYASIFRIKHHIIFDYERIKFFMQYAFFKNNFYKNFDPLNYKHEITDSFLDEYFYNREDVNFYKENKSKLLLLNNLIITKPILRNNKLTTEYFNSFTKPSYHLLETKLGVGFLMTNHSNIDYNIMIDIMQHNKDKHNEINEVLDRFMWNNYENISAILHCFKKVYDDQLEIILENKHKKLEFKVYLKYIGYKKECVKHLCKNYELKEILEHYYMDNDFVFDCIKEKFLEDPYYNFIFLYENIKHNDNIIEEIVELINHQHTNDYKKITTDCGKNENALITKASNSQHINQMNLDKNKNAEKNIVKNLEFLNSNSNEFGQVDFKCEKFNDERNDNAKKIFEWLIVQKQIKHHILFVLVRNFPFLTNDLLVFYSKKCQIDNAKKIVELKNMLSEKNHKKELNYFKNQDTVSDLCFKLAISDDPVLLVENSEHLMTLIQIYGMYKPYIFYFFDLIIQNVDSDNSTILSCIKETFNDEALLFTVANKIKVYLNQSPSIKFLNIMNNRFGYFTDKLFLLEKTISLSNVANKLLKTTETLDFLKLPNKEMIDVILDTTFEYYIDKKTEKILFYRLKKILIEIKRDKSDIEFGKRVLQIISNLHNIIEGYDYLLLDEYLIILLTDNRFVDEIADIFSKWVSFDRNIIEKFYSLLDKDLRIAKVFAALLLELQDEDEDFVEDKCFKILFDNIEKNNNISVISSGEEKKESNDGKQSKNSNMTKSENDKEISNIEKVSWEMETDINNNRKLYKPTSESDQKTIITDDQNFLCLNNENVAKQEISNKTLNFLAYAPSLKCFKKHKNTFLPVLKSVFLGPQNQIAVKSFILIYSKTIENYIIDSIFNYERGNEALQIFEEVIHKKKEQKNNKITNKNSITSNINNTNDCSMIFAMIYILKFDSVEKIKRKSFELWITHFKMGLINEIMIDLILLCYYENKKKDVFEYCFMEVLDKYEEVLKIKLDEIILCIKTYKDRLIEVQNDSKNYCLNEEINNAEKCKDIYITKNDKINTVKEDNVKNLINDEPESTSNKNIEKHIENYSLHLYNDLVTQDQLTNNVIQNKRNEKFEEIKKNLETNNVTNKINLNDITFNNELEFTNPMLHDTEINKLVKIHNESFLYEKCNFDTFINILIKNIASILKKAVKRGRLTETTYNFTSIELNEELILFLITNKKYKEKMLNIIIENKLEYSFLLENSKVIDELFIKTSDEKLIPFTSNKFKMQLINNNNSKLKDKNNAKVSFKIMSSAERDNIFQNVIPSKEWESFLSTVDPFYSVGYLKNKVFDFGGLKMIFERVFDTCEELNELIDPFYADYLKDVSFKNIKLLNNLYLENISNEINDNIKNDYLQVEDFKSSTASIVNNEITPEFYNSIVNNYEKLFYIFNDKQIYKRMSEIVLNFCDDKIIEIMLCSALNGNIEIENSLKYCSSNNSVLNDYLYTFKE